MTLEAFKGLKLTSLYPNHKATKPYYSKQKYAVHYVTSVAFCITTPFLGTYAFRFF